ncbi:tryptophan 2,3-dioxygenase family protein [Streptomyces sp. NPDC001568]|uniref:tryptophan 2,3-dioxygenase family protein n=1 Tax=Streptomyces sp. NPDC001568 TaxID=3364588 RepID=UPI0036AB124F
MTDTIAEPLTATAVPAPAADVTPQPLSYGTYLEVPGLLELQRPRTDAHDELLFIVTHQAIELWFSCALHELEQVRACLDQDLLSRARWGLRRLTRMNSLWLGHLDVLATMTPAGFNEFRGALGESSGFQSVQFRELEMLSGLRDRRYLNLPGATVDERERLLRRFHEPSLNDAFHALLERRGLSVEKLFAPGAPDEELRDTAEDLLAYDALFHQWRYQHWMLVVRALGTRPGSGGSAGSEFLRTTLDKWFFPELHEARSQVHAAPTGETTAEGDGDVVYGCPMGYGPDPSS